MIRTLLRRLCSLLLAVSFLLATGTSALAELGCLHHGAHHGEPETRPHTGEHHHGPAHPDQGSAHAYEHEASHLAHSDREVTHGPHGKGSTDREDCHCVSQCHTGGAPSLTDSGQSGSSGAAPSSLRHIHPTAVATPQAPVPFLLHQPNAPPLSR